MFRHQCAQLVSQVAGLGWHFSLLKKKRNRNDQIAGLSLQIEILCFDITVLN